MSDYTVVGLGASERGDDAIGLVVAERLAQRGLRTAQVTSPLDLLDVFDGHDTVVVVDATRSDQPAGTVSVSRGSYAVCASGSTHGFGLTEAVELARALDRLPARLLVVGVEIGETTVGAALSEPVAAAVDEAVDRVVACLALTPGGP